MLKSSKYIWEFKLERVALFIPCFVDTVYPRVAIATHKILKDLGFEVEYPKDQTCCGQPLYNSGFKNEAKELAERFYNIFKDYDYIVAPSGSCISMVKIHYKELLNSNEYEEISSKSFEICEFLHDVVELKSLSTNFPYKVALHKSCHGLRELELGVSSELNLPYNNKVENLLQMVEGLELVEMERSDECCGFGGTFSTNYDDISMKMGRDKIEHFLSTKADYLVGYDNSCLMHLCSIEPSIKTLHVVEILAGVVDETP